MAITPRRDVEAFGCLAPSTALEEVILGMLLSHDVSRFHISEFGEKWSLSESELDKTVMTALRRVGIFAAAGVLEADGTLPKATVKHMHDAVLLVVAKILAQQRYQDAAFASGTCGLMVVAQSHWLLRAISMFSKLLRAHTP